MSIEAEPSTEAESNEAPSSRRSLLTKGAMAAAVATVAGLAVAEKVSAGNGNNQPMAQGAANINATLTTSLAGGSTFLVTDGGSETGLKSSIHAEQSVVDRVGVWGNSTVGGGTGSSAGVLGRHTSGTGYGVWGVNFGNGGYGVYGQHNESTLVGTGVLGRSNGGAGVAGNGSSYDFAAIGSGRLNLKAGGFANPPAGNFAGTIASDAVGNLWYSPTNGVFQKLNSSSGLFFPLTPGRVYDSRQTLPSPGPLVAGANRTISVADRRDALLNTGAVVEANFVPAGAVAVSANVTITGTAGAGFLTVNPGGNTTVGASTINWKADNQDIANGIILALNATRELTIICGGGGSTGFIIDINGYYL